MALARGRRWFALSLNRVQPQSHGERRYQRILQSVLTGFFGKGVSIVVSFLAVPLALGYLGAELYGVWITISTLLVWISLADLGLGNGLTNLLAAAYGKERPDLAQKYVATAFWLLTGIAVLIGCAFVIVWRLLDWPLLFGVESFQAKIQVAPAILAAVVIYLMSFPLLLVNKILNAYQEGALGNLWLGLGGLASLLGLVVVTHARGGLVQLVIGYSGMLWVVMVASAVWLFFRHKTWLLPRWSAVNANTSTN